MKFRLSVGVFALVTLVAFSLFWNTVYGINYRINQDRESGIASQNILLSSLVNKLSEEANNYIKTVHHEKTPVPENHFFYTSQSLDASPLKYVLVSQVKRGELIVDHVIGPSGIAIDHDLLDFQNLLNQYHPIEEDSVFWVPQHAGLFSKYTLMITRKNGLHFVGFYEKHYFQQLNKIAKHSIAVITESGRVLSHENSDYVGSSFESYSWFDKLRESRTIAGKVSFDQETSLRKVHYRAVVGTNILVIAVQEPEVLMSTAQIFWALIVVFALAILGNIALWKIVKPPMEVLQQVTHHLEALGNGEEIDFSPVRWSGAKALNANILHLEERLRWADDQKKDLVIEPPPLPPEPSQGPAELKAIESVKWSLSAVLAQIQVVKSKIDKPDLKEEMASIEKKSRFARQQIEHFKTQ